ncbi:MAG: DHH family phosphoesterase, partial [Candidatus Aenigmarchaeota archaeon]|nr:DHH family phosphoesterase [Candidatus Aenigmarchaeota archaeon]
MNFLELSKKAIEKIKSTDSIIQIVTHNDADGLSAAAILVYALAYLKKRFQVTIVKKINSNTTDALLSRNPELIICTDIGSSYPEEIKKLSCDVIILDHHDVKEELPQNVIHLNPEAFGLTGMSGSGTVYLFTKDIINDNRLAPLALVGTIGDSAESIYNIFDDISSIGRKTGLKLYGRFTRPLHKALEYSSEIPNISDESKAIQFLAENGIQIKEGERWRTLGDLNEHEYQKLCDSLIREQVEHGYDISKLFGDVWTLKNFPQEIQDAKEFATLLNACGRMGEGGIGIGICLGSKLALEKSKSVIRDYRSAVSKSLRWVENNPEKVKNTDSATYIIAQDAINE